MNNQLLEETSKMLENENQWRTAYKLAELIPEIKKLWFIQFIDLLSDNIKSKLETNDGFKEFQIMTSSEKDVDYRRWYIMPENSNNEKNDAGDPLGLSTAIEIGIERNEYYSCFGLIYLYKKKPALAKLETYFNENLHTVLPYFDKNIQGVWYNNDWGIWNTLYPKGKNPDLAEPETIYYLHMKGIEFIDIIVEKILKFVSEHHDALISAHTRLIK